ncbi:Ankyrin repeat domain-containing protein 54 [Hondaea fermentalgiana]|uniref:Ankyrin repeat domain-containing protein 54 n=1 Tax=Hondaea fermentalgiana TaxID=2315210 RepID=A0A2R5G9G0_9STRA|nr:Ankyrin repeat domain-containing protein 54 [Hondaea fermentalgiana]|eukprot:GBG27702.1 Ankyrin repeat domain-containing protein 54 [Hondaea fermentalgiana]
MVRQHEDEDIGRNDKVMDKAAQEDEVEVEAEVEAEAEGKTEDKIKDKDKDEKIGRPLIISEPMPQNGSLAQACRPMPSWPGPKMETSPTEGFQELEKTAEPPQRKARTKVRPRSPLPPAFTEASSSASNDRGAEPNDVSVADRASSNAALLKACAEGDLTGVVKWANSVRQDGDLLAARLHGVCRSDGWGPLALAVEARNPGVVEMLVHWNAESAPRTYAAGLNRGRDEERASALHHICHLGDEALLEAALRAGAGHSVAAGLNLEARDPRGRTPLHVAASRIDAAATKLLLDHGASPVAKDKLGNSPLHLAVAAAPRFEVPASFVALLRPRIDARNREDETPLHVAASSGANEAVAELIVRGADVHAVDNSSMMRTNPSAAEVSLVALGDAVQIRDAALGLGTSIEHEATTRTERALDALRLVLLQTDPPVTLTERFQTPVVKDALRFVYQGSLRGSPLAAFTANRDTERFVDGREVLAHVEDAVSLLVLANEWLLPALETLATEAVHLLLERHVLTSRGLARRKGTPRIRTAHVEELCRFAVDGLGSETLVDICNRIILLMRKLKRKDNRHVILPPKECVLPHGHDLQCSCPRGMLERHGLRFCRRPDSVVVDVAQMLAASEIDGSSVLALAPARLRKQIEAEGARLDARLYVEPARYGQEGDPAGQQILEDLGMVITDDVSTAPDIDEFEARFASLAHQSHVSLDVSTAIAANEEEGDATSDRPICLYAAAFSNVVDRRTWEVILRFVSIGVIEDGCAPRSTAEAVSMAQLADDLGLVGFSHVLQAILDEKDLMSSDTNGKERSTALNMLLESKFHPTLWELEVQFRCELLEVADTSSLSPQLEEHLGRKFPENLPRSCACAVLALEGLLRPHLEPMEECGKSRPQV